MRLPLDPAEALVIVGAQAVNPSDRSLRRDEIYPVQVLVDHGFQAVPALDRGVHGMGSLLLRPEAGLVYGSTGDDFFRLDLSNGTVTDVTIAGLKNVHEITEVDGTAWLANTGSDEAIGFDLQGETVTRRIALRPARGSEPVLAQAVPLGAAASVDKFHANQVFRALDGRLYVLVHHVNGRQIVKLVAKRVIKMQGNGGVIDLETGRKVALSLNGPHSVRTVGTDEQIICDSRAAVIRAYDRDWRQRAEIACAGWGRGVSVSERTGISYVGISAVRKRYLHAIPTSQHSPNMVQAFDIARRALIGEAEVPHVELVCNVYCVTRETATALLDL